MSLIVTKITRQPEKDDKYQNWSYWAEFEGIEGGVLVSHKGHIDPLKVGDDALAAGFERVDDVPKKNGGGTYKKLMRPAQQGGFGGGGYKGKSPEEQRAITRSVAWKIVVGERGLLDRDAAEYDRVQPWVKKVFDDLQKASQG